MVASRQGKMPALDESLLTMSVRPRYPRGQEVQTGCRQPIGRFVGRMRQQPTKKEVCGVVYGVIMAGGRGERFWPLSRIRRPKQFLKLTSDKTMLAETIERVGPLIPLSHIRIVTGESMTKLIAESYPDLGGAHLLTEPQARNTCLAIGLAAVHIQKEDPTGVMVVLSADHLIRPPEKLLAILSDACKVASRSDYLITLGIVPTRPDTGYGYIRLGDTFSSPEQSPINQVGAFVEKPKAALAQEYYYSRQYLWNSGMFVWSAQSILKAITSCKPDMGSLLATYQQSIGTQNEQRERERLYQEAESISIDYAVLEKAANVLVISADFVWDDIGSWNALDRYKSRDANNNVQVGQCLLFDSFETIAYNDGQGIIATLGVSDLVIVRSGEITFVAHKTKVGEIKAVLAKLGADAATSDFL